MASVPLSLKQCELDVPTTAEQGGVSNFLSFDTGFCVTAIVLLIIPYFGFAVSLVVIPFSPPTWSTMKGTWCHSFNHVKRPERWLHKCQNNSASINAWRQDKCTWIYFWLAKALTTFGSVNAHTHASSVQTPAVALICFYGFKSRRVTSTMQLTVMPSAETLGTTPYSLGSFYEILSQKPAILIFWFLVFLVTTLRNNVSACSFFDHGLERKRVQLWLISSMRKKRNVSFEFWE